DPGGGGVVGARLFLGSLNYVIVPLISRAVFGEVISTGHYAGIGFIAVGVGLTMLAKVSG
ncbi:MAG: hypothetical protein ACI8RZ_005154, partial [Myxococcota bacterium]